MRQLIRSLLFFFSFSLFSFPLKSYFKDPTQCWFYPMLSVSTISQEATISSTKLLILFGVEHFFVFHVLALTSQWQISVLFSDAGQVQSCIHRDGGAGGRWSWGLGWGGGAGLHPAVVYHPDNEAKTGFLTCGNVWTTVGLTKEGAQFKYGDTQKRN